MRKGRMSEPADSIGYPDWALWCGFCAAGKGARRTDEADPEWRKGWRSFHRRNNSRGMPTRLTRVEREDGV